MNAISLYRPRTQIRQLLARREQSQFKRANSVVERLSLAILATSVMASNAMAQGGVGGGTGTSDVVAARVSSTASSAQIILWSIAGILFTCAGLYTTIGIATLHKKWSDLSTVCLAMVAGGLMVAICGWLFS